MKLIYVFSTALLLTTSTVAFGDTTREAETHEHGHSALNIAIEGNVVALELEAPGADIVGFEHAASSDEDKAMVAKAMTTLEKPLDLFVVPSEAGCKKNSAEVELEGEGEHNEFHAKYELMCSAPEKINKITFKFFEMFPKSSEIELNLVTGSGQTAYEVERDQLELVLK